MNFYLERKISAFDNSCDNNLMRNFLEIKFDDIL
jgi:hypothetical protein